MSTILGVLMIVAILSIPFFLARLMDRITGKHRRMDRNKDNTKRPRVSGAAREAKDDAHREAGSNFHSPGGPGD